MSIIATPIIQNDSPAACQPAGSRWMVVTPPVARVVSATQLRDHCRLPYPAEAGGEDDETLYLFIDAATAYAEARLATSLMPRVLRAKFEANERIDLPYGPVIEVLEVAGRDEPPTTAYSIVNFGYTVRIVPTGSIRYPVFVNYKAGHRAATAANTPAVPADIRLAILMHAATLYGQRESISDKPMTAVPHTLEAFYAGRSRQPEVG